MRRELTPKQSKFVEQYVIDLNATQAAIRAGYSAKTAEVQGCRLVKHCSGAIEAGLAKQARQSVLTKERLVHDLHQTFCAAVAAKHFAGAARLGELLARLHGYIVETRNVRMIRSISDLSDEELQALAAGDGTGATAH